VRTLALILMLAMGAATPAALAVAARKPAAKTSARTAPGKKKSTRKAAPPSRYTGQTAPSPDRYREIQQALIDRGFLTGEPTGVWDARSIEAMKRLEQSLDLRVDGKIDARTLTALGLGPKRTPAASEGVELQ
jgi:peptidoglycan hydrolase-like protein with peptidoglycan-binding domain